MGMFKPDQEDKPWEQRLLTRTGRFVLTLAFFFYIAAMMVVTEAIFKAISTHVGPTLAPFLKG